MILHYSRPRRCCCLLWPRVLPTLWGSAARSNAGMTHQAVARKVDTPNASPNPEPRGNPRRSPKRRGPPKGGSPTELPQKAALLSPPPRAARLSGAAISAASSGPWASALELLRFALRPEGFSSSCPSCLRSLRGGSGRPASPTRSASQPAKIRSRNRGGVELWEMFGPALPSFPAFTFSSSIPMPTIPGTEGLEPRI